MYVLGGSIEDEVKPLTFSQELISSENEISVSYLYTGLKAPVVS